MASSNVEAYLQDAYKVYSGKAGDGKSGVTKLEAIFALADMGLLEHVAVAQVVQNVVEAQLRRFGNTLTLVDFNRLVAAAMKLQGGKKENLPMAPRGFSQMLLKEAFATACGVRGDANSPFIRIEVDAFIQMITDSGVAGSKRFKPENLKVIFARVRKPGETNINYEQFQKSVTLMAKESRSTFETIGLMLIPTQGGTPPTGRTSSPRQSRSASPRFTGYDNHGDSPRSNLSTGSTYRSGGSTLRSNGGGTMRSNGGGTMRSSGSPRIGSPTRQYSGTSGFLTDAPLTLQNLVKRRSGTAPLSRKIAVSSRSHMAPVAMAAMNSKHRKASADEEKVFNQYDCDGTGRITLSDTQDAFRALGVFKNLVENKNVFFENVLIKSGKNNQNFVSLEDFACLVFVAGKMKEQSYLGPGGGTMSQEARGYMRNRDLRAAFHSFAAYGSGVEAGMESSIKSMDNSHFAKICRECGLMNKKDALFGTMDIIFTKVKPMNTRKLEYRQFLEALVLIAAHKNSTIALMVDRILEVAHPHSNKVTASLEFNLSQRDGGGSPQFGGNALEAVFASYDPDNSGYINKGDVLFALAEMGSLADLPFKAAGDIVARTLKEVDPESQNKVSMGEMGWFHDRLKKLRQTMANRKGAPRVPVHYRTNAEAKTVFLQAAQADHSDTFASATMGRQQFFKLCMETFLRDATTPLSALEVCFADNVQKGTKVLAFPQFLQALAALAADKEETFEEVFARVMAAPATVVNAAARPPLASGPAPRKEADGGVRDMAANAFNAYVQGDSGCLGKQEVLILLADIDGYPNFTNKDLSDHFEKIFKEICPERVVTLDAFIAIFAAMKKAEATRTPPVAVAIPTMNYTDHELMEAFNFFAGSSRANAAMTATRFCKMSLETGLTDYSRITNTACNVIFARARAKGSTTMNFRGFLNGLALIAADKKMSFKEAADMVLKAGHRKILEAAQHGSPSSSVVSSILPSSSHLPSPELEYKAPPPGARPFVNSSGTSYGGANIASYGANPTGPAAPSTDGANLGGKTKPSTTPRGNPGVQPPALHFANLNYNTAFDSYADNSSINRTVHREELPYVLADMGLLEGVNSSAAAAEIAITLQELLAEDTDEITSEDFSIFTHKIDHLKRNQMTAAPAPLAVPAEFSSHTPLVRRFDEMCNFGGGPDSVTGQMDLAMFVKLVDQVGLLDKAFTAQAAELCFARARSTGERTMTYDTFLKALAIIASDKATSLGALIKTLLNAGDKPPPSAEQFSLVTLDRRFSSMQLMQSVGSEEVVYTLADLGLLEGLTCQPIADTIFSMLNSLNREVTMEDFPALAAALHVLKRAEAHIATPVKVALKHMQSELLQATFVEACGIRRDGSPQKRMDLSTFQALALGIPRLSTSTAPAALVAFAKARPRFETTISFNSFLYALAMLSNGQDIDAILGTVMSSTPRAEASPPTSSRRTLNGLGKGVSPPAPSQAATPQPQTAPSTSKVPSPPTVQSAPVAPPPGSDPAMEHAFNMHAKKGLIGRLQLTCTLGYLGSLHKLDPRRASHLTGEMLQRADTDKDGLVNYAQFHKLYTEFVKAYGQPGQLPAAEERPEGVSKEAWEKEAVAALFKSHCPNRHKADQVPAMDAEAFVKFCNESTLVTKTFTLAAAEVIYARSKAMERSKYMHFNAFKHALHAVAEDRFDDYSAIVDQVIAHSQPSASGGGGEGGSGAPDTTPRAITPRAASNLGNPKAHTTASSNSLAAAAPAPVEAELKEQKKKKKGFFKRLFASSQPK